MKENVTREAVVLVIDNDASVRAALKDLFHSVGLEVRLYATASAFLETRIPDATSCLVLDVRLPDMSGIRVQDALSRSGVSLPIVFITGHGDVAMAVRAMKAGAIDFLTKPFRSQDILDADDATELASNPAVRIAPHMVNPELKGTKGDSGNESDENKDHCNLPLDDIIRLMLGEASHRSMAQHITPRQMLDHHGQLGLAPPHVH